MTQIDPRSRRGGILRVLSLCVAIGMVCSLALPAIVARAGEIPIPDAPVTTASLRTGPSGHRWEGSVDISFRNDGGGPLSQIWLRLWPNGIDGCATSLPLTVSDVVGGTPGALQVGCTALPIDLDAPVAPGARGSVSMHLVIEVPHRNDRFGWSNELTFVGTPLPALALEDSAGLHLDPYSNLGESFYSTVGDYAVTLDTPEGLATPATGVRTGGGRAGRRLIRTYTADGVRDFAWAAGPLKARSGADRAGVAVRAWYLPGAAQQADAALADAISAMDEYSADFGDFPYPQMDVVVSSFASFGGMEYPTIVFSNQGASVVSHEVAHQWWYGIVGDDEYRAPWLDEAFASWAEDLPIDPSAAVGCRPGPWPSPEARVTNDMDYWDAHPSEYFRVVYGQGGCALRALAARFGLGRFIQILHDYAATQWLGFSTSADLKETIESAAATDLPAWDMSRFWARWRIGPG